MNARNVMVCGLISLTVSVGSAHEGHDHGPAIGEQVASGPVTLSDEAIKNLEIRTVEAKIVPLQRSLTMIGRIQGLPERQAKIAPRAEGRVAEILVKLGDRVTAGQPVLQFDPLTVGNPPVVLRSPIDGFVIRQDANIGQALSPATVPIEVADYSQVLARGTTFETPDLALIKPGQEARVRLAVFGDHIFEGKVQRLDVGLESESRTFEVYVLLENPELQLRPNMQATLSIALGEATEALAVPQRAVLGDLGNLFVFVRDGNTFERRNVIVGTKSDDQVEIVEGVLPGEQVVTQGNYQLQFATGDTKNIAAAADEHGPAGHSHEQGEIVPHKHAPPWLWAIGGFVIGGLLFGLLLRRNPPGTELT
ncbi:MAG TPA: efflux RND transporter periplasmic adaptor subunit [Chthoniobacterales bacterium]|nr:efflux RND transporter periplasmic adaptor subunit [Chthoniobacterales bacterium]